MSRAVRPRSASRRAATRRARYARLAWFVRAAKDGWRPV